MPAAKKNNRIDVITMGCSKNLVDSEQLMYRLAQKGYEMYHDSEDVKGSVVILNTCGFIADAKEQSIEMLLDIVNAKNEGIIDKIYVMGCLSERYRDALPAEVSEVDGWYGKFDWDKIIEKLPTITKEEGDYKPWDRILTQRPFRAYIKIAEGCNRMCAYCAIPLITGRLKSRSREEILAEVRSLVAKGVKEFNVIAQDLSGYGTDLNDNKISELPELIDEMARIEGVDWIRLHYAYPVDFPWEVLDVMNKHDNVCKYLDIALQHISTPVLANMRRHINKEETLQLIDRIREKVPGICLRTTLMTGFPGETEEAFRELKEFVKTSKFNKLGVFAYSEEEDTWAARHLEDSIPQEVKLKRQDEILNIQDEIYEEYNRNMIGRKLRVIIDDIEGEVFICRSEYDSPDVDQIITAPVSDFPQAAIGQFIEVEIVDFLDMELQARKAID